MERIQPEPEIEKHFPVVADATQPVIPVDAMRMEGWQTRSVT